MKKWYYYLVVRRRLILIYLLVMLGIYSWGLLLWEIPTEMYVTKGEKLEMQDSLPVRFEAEETEEVFADRWRDHYQVKCNLFGIIPVKSVTVHVVDEKKVIPVGQTVGILLHTKGVYVVDTDVIESEQGKNISPCGKNVLPGDYITAVNGKAVSTKEEVIRAVENSNGEMVELSIRRENDSIKCEVAPVMSKNHNYKLGIWIKDDIAGVGTITYIDQEGNYGALGHGISSSETEKLIELDAGSLYETEIAAINKGETGSPGSLVGLLYFQKEHYLGTVDKNSDVGIFGSLNENGKELICQEYLPVAYKQEIHAGEANIYASVDGVVQSYKIEIEDVMMNSPDENKSMLIRVTDEKLIQKTGGIVQGVSGSPIIQDGKLVGAVTHVLVNDPTRGYGIFIENMLEAAE